MGDLVEFGGIFTGAGVVVLLEDVVGEGVWFGAEDDFDIVAVVKRLFKELLLWEAYCLAIRVCFKGANVVV